MTTQARRARTRASCPSTAATAAAPATPSIPSGYRTALPLGGGLGARQLPRHPRALHPPADRGEEARRQEASRRRRSIFPRYHQLDCVRKLRGRRARATAPGTQLPDPALGRVSGKSNSIAWLAHRLAEPARRRRREGLRLGRRHHRPPRARPAAPGHDLPVRAQAGRRRRRSTRTRSSSPRRSTRGHADHHHDAPEVPLRHREDRRAAEARATPSSSTRRTARRRGESAREAEGRARGAHVARARPQRRTPTTSRGLRGRDPQGDGRRAARSRTCRFFAFTATPKYKTLEVFGRPGRRRQARSRSTSTRMRQAIEEGFILDVLANYTTYKTYYRPGEGGRGRPQGRRSSRPPSALARFMSLHPHNIAQKTEVMVEHFRAHRSATRSAARRRRWSSPARACTPSATSRRSTSTSPRRATRTSAPGRLLRRRCRIPTCAASSYTEVGMNDGITEKELPEQVRRATSTRCCSSPRSTRPASTSRCCTRCTSTSGSSGVQAVQTLSRLNRIAPGQGGHLRPRLRERRRGDPASRSSPTTSRRPSPRRADPQQLYELQHQLDAMQVFWATEVEAFCKVFFTPKEKQTVADHAEMYRQLDPAVDRFKALERGRAGGVPERARRLRATSTRFLSQVMPFHGPGPGEALHLRPLPRAEAADGREEGAARTSTARSRSSTTGSTRSARGRSR